MSIIETKVRFKPLFKRNGLLKGDKVKKQGPTTHCIQDDICNNVIHSSTLERRAKESQRIQRKSDQSNTDVVQKWTRDTEHQIKQKELAVFSFWWRIPCVVNFLEQKHGRCILGFLAQLSLFLGYLHARMKTWLMWNIGVTGGTRMTPYGLTAGI